MKKIIVLLIVLLTAAYPSRCLSAALGPYSGKVLDATTGGPVKGASVVVYWTRQLPQLMESRSELVDAKLVYTDDRGNYQVPRSSGNLGLTGVLEYTVVIAYQPGYQAYIVKITHLWQGEKKGPAFQEANNVIRLERVPPNFEHKSHHRAVEDAFEDMRLWYDDLSPYTKDTGSYAALLRRCFLLKDEFFKRLEWEERRGDEDAQ